MELARGQEDVLSLEQLRAAGLSDSAVRKRAARGVLHRIHRTVYALGTGRLTRQGHVMAAVLACGPGAAASHQTAAREHGLRPDNRPIIDVSVPRASVRQQPGIRVHAAASLRECEAIDVDGIRCTAVARTALDLAETLDPRGVERFIHEAEVKRVFDLREFEDVLAHATGRRGAPVVRAVLDGLCEPAITEGDLAELFYVLCEHGGLERAETEQWLVLEDGGPAVRADFLWRRQRLVVETDGRGAHATRRAFESDRRRDQRLIAAGHRVVRFTWRQITSEPERVIETMRRLLAH